MFRGIYDVCTSCDNVNFSANTVWNQHTPSEHASVFQNEIINEATDLKDIAGHTYDFLLSSNSLEHTANPLKAMREFCRVLRPGGMMILILPDKTETFDHQRPYTTMEHLVEDERNHVDEHDLTHLEEILKLHDLSMDVPMSYVDFVKRCLDNYNNRCMHQHVFSLALLREIAEYLQLRVEECCQLYSGLLLKAYL